MARRELINTIVQLYKKLGGNLNNTNLAEWKQMLEQDIDDFLALVEESGNKDYNRIKK